MNVGQVVKITGTPKNAAGNTIVADVSYSSSNTAQISISPTGFVCAGIWDANFINCSALPGQTGVGQATITATSGSVTATAPVFAHLQVDQISVNPPGGCVSVGATPTYAATAYNTTSQGCSQAVPCDITSTIGPVTFFSTNLTVMSNNASTGVLTANEPGATSIYANISGLNSIPQTALVCPVVSIQVHDANSSNTTFNLAPTNTQSLVADVIDSNGVSIRPSLTWSSVPTGVASVSLGTSTTTNSATVTTNTGGTTTIVATCATPTCNIGVNPQYSQNIVTVNVSGGTTTTVYAASSKSLTMIPIQSSNNTAGTAIALPYFPNSLVSNSSGTKLYLGSSTGIMTVDVNTASVTVSTAALGKIIAVAPSGQYLLVSDSANTVTYLFDVTNSKVLSSQDVIATAGAFAPDGNAVMFTTTGQQLYYNTVSPTSTAVALSYVPSSLDVSAQGGMTYIASPTLGAIDIRATCNQADWQTLSATAPTLVAHLPNGNGAVAVDSPNIDVVATGAIPSGCLPTPQSSVNTYNLGFGNFTATQMFIPPNSGGVFILSNLPAVLGFDLNNLVPFSIPLTNSPQPLSGGIMIDSSKIYIGASDNNVHALDVATHTDSAQIAPGLKDQNGSVVAPDLVLVLPK